MKWLSEVLAQMYAYGRWDNHLAAKMHAMMASELD